MKSYRDENIEFKGCPGCAYGNHEFALPCGMAYEDEFVTLSQDWELPIPGFFVVSPKRHVEKLAELTSEEKIELNEIVDKTIMILRENNICENFNIISEEKENRHYHIWIMPRHKWMTDRFGNIMYNIREIFDYAKTNMRTEEVYNQINEITKIIKKELESKKLYKRFYE